MSARSSHVLILVENLPVPFDRRVWQESQTLRRAGHKVTVICPAAANYDKSFEQIEGIDIFRYNPRIEGRGFVGLLIEYLVALFSMLFLSLRVRLKSRIHIVHVCNPPDLLFLPAIPLVLLGAKLVYDQHDACPELAIAKGSGPRSTTVRLCRLLERVTYRVATVVISPNGSYKDLAVTRGRKSPDRVFVVRSGPRSGMFVASGSTDRFKGDRRYLAAYVGVMGVQEGLDYLIDAVKHIETAFGRSDIRFVLAGSGPELTRLKARVIDEGLEDSMEFLGRVSDQVLVELLSSADICVNPDEANEMNNISTMNKVLEYMSVGRPIVQFDLKEGRYSAGESSRYARPNDAVSFAREVVWLCDNPTEAEQMGLVGRRRYREDLSWEAQEGALLAAYRTALDIAVPSVEAAL